MLYSAAPADTAAYWLKGRMLSANFDRGQHRLFDAVRAISESGQFGMTRSPDEHAVTFYLLNHVATAIAQSRDLMEPLPQVEMDVLRSYAETGSDIARRLFWYVLLITTREARHNNSSVSGKLNVVAKAVQEAYPDITKEQIEEMFEFTKSAPDTSQIVAHMMVPKTMNFPLGPFCKLLSVLYYKCSWGSAYGGPKWGNIADALHAFVSGEWSAEIFADTAFTLAHNTAPIFNKGMLYSSPGMHFIQILDVQRAGMVPQWVEQYGGSAYQGVMYNMCKTARPELFEGEVDWAKVQSLGAVGFYGNMVPKAPPKPPAGCANKQIEIDHANKVWVLAKRAA